MISDKKINSTNALNGFEIKVVPTKGRAAVASKTFKKGDIIFYDLPLCATELVESFPRGEVCSYCMMFIGSLNTQFGSLSGEVPQNLPALDPSDAFLSPVVPCDIPHDSNSPKLCKELYCSKDCKEKAKKKYHRILCPDFTKSLKNEDKDGFSIFRELVIQEDLQYYLMALKIVMELVLEQEEFPMQDKETETFWKANPKFTASIPTQPPLRNILPHYFAKDFFSEGDESDSENESEIFHQSFKILYSFLQSLSNSGVFGPFGDRKISFFSINFYGWLLGLLRLNSHVITITSPLAEYTTLIHSLPPPHKQNGIKSILPIIEQIVQRHPNLQDSESQYSNPDSPSPTSLPWSRKIPNLDTSIFPSVSGVGLFPLLSMLNHSCTPNCKVIFSANFGCTIVAKRNIQKFEEIVVTYVDPKDSYEERTKELKHYGFTCDCKKCKNKE